MIFTDFKFIFGPPAGCLTLDRPAILRDRQRGHSLGQLAKTNLVSRATIHRVIKEHAATSLGAVSKGLENAAP